MHFNYVTGLTLELNILLFLSYVQSILWGKYAVGFLYSYIHQCVIESNLKVI